MGPILACSVQNCSETVSSGNLGSLPDLHLSKSKATEFNYLNYFKKGYFNFP